MNVSPTATYRDDWNTPDSVLNPVRGFFGGEVDLDPCSNATSLVRAETEYRLPDRDGLKEPWFGGVFVNPPYGRGIGPWLDRCAEAHTRWDAEVVALVPASTDTKYFQRALDTADAVCFWAGRIRFVGAPQGAMFPSALLYWGHHSGRFQQCLSQHGAVVAAARDSW